MIFADKLITLRKKAGWSQEELAEKLGVTRQSVSKWEGAQSVPDIDKILQLARLFGVTTDYLLKEEQGEPEYTAEDDTPALRKVTLAQANDCLAKAQANAPKMALATALCIVSPDLPRRTVNQQPVPPQRGSFRRPWADHPAGAYCYSCRSFHAVRRGR